MTSSRTGPASSVALRSWTARPVSPSVSLARLGSIRRANPYRGFYVADAEVVGLLQREPGAPRLWVGDDGAGPDAPLPEGDPALRLQRLFHLSGFELDAVIVALAVDIDLKYQRLFAWLQDDATRRRPTVSLLLDLFCQSTAARLDRLRAFADDAPLVAGGIVHLVADEGPSTPRIACAVRLDEAVVRHLLGH